MFRISALCLLVWTAHLPHLGAAEPPPPPAPSTSRTGKTFAPPDDLGTVAELPARRFELVPGKNPNDWTFVIEPYAWAIGVSGNVGVLNRMSAQIDFEMQDIIQHLDWGIMGRGELRKGRWGLLGDGLFAQLSGGATPPGPFYNNANIQLQQGMASLALACRVIDDRRGFIDVYAGARYNYFNINLGASADSEGIQNVTNAAISGVTRRIAARADAFISQNADGSILANVLNAVGSTVASELEANSEAIIQGVKNNLTPREIIELQQKWANRSGAYRELLAAVVEARIAAAAGQLTDAIKKGVASAEKKLAKAVAQDIENALPTDASGNDWWVDPIVGLRGQINFTRWLFLAAQGDVGGFGAGSQIAWNTQATIGINFTRNIFGEIGYRYYYLDYDGQYISYNGAESGVFTGIGVKF